MRLASFSLSALALAACGGASDEARVELPLKSPEGAHQFVADFVDVCSLYLVDREAAITLAGERGWINEVGSGLATMTMGISVFRDPETDANMQFIPASYTHLESRMCMVINPSAYKRDEDFNLSIIHEVEGLQGGFIPSVGPQAGGSGVGRWSFIADNGQVVLVNVTNPTDSILQLNMITHKHLTPK